jgi:hypothetical protein
VDCSFKNLRLIYQTGCNPNGPVPDLAPVTLSAVRLTCYFGTAKLCELPHNKLLKRPADSSFHILSDSLLNDRIISHPVILHKMIVKLKSFVNKPRGATNSVHLLWSLMNALRSPLMKWRRANGLLMLLTASSKCIIYHPSNSIRQQFLESRLPVQLPGLRISFQMFRRLNARHLVLTSVVGAPSCADLCSWRVILCWPL